MMSTLVLQTTDEPLFYELNSEDDFPSFGPRSFVFWTGNAEEEGRGRPPGG